MDRALLTVKVKRNTTTSLCRSILFAQISPCSRMYRIVSSRLSNRILGSALRQGGTVRAGVPTVLLSKDLLFLRPLDGTTTQLMQRFSSSANLDEDHHHHHHPDDNKDTLDGRVQVDKSSTSATKSGESAAEPRWRVHCETFTSYSYLFCKTLLCL